MLMEGRPDCTMALNALDAVLHSSSLGSTCRMAMHSDSEDTRAGKVATRTCHGTLSLYQPATVSATLHIQLDVRHLASTDTSSWLPAPSPCSSPPPCGNMGCCTPAAVAGAAIPVLRAWLLLELLGSGEGPPDAMTSGTPSLEPRLVLGRGELPRAAPRLLGMVALVGSMGLPARLFSCCRAPTATLRAGDRPTAPVVGPLGAPGTGR
mmetsp:Transcript_1145/g.3235  ORF Transcript_1145/g.3235 Transcript_1145/m.3235 type:complete len:208 (-) Transcript_1145:1240-1863(-)